MSDLLSKSVLRGDRKIYRYLYIVNRGEHDDPPRLLFRLFLQGKYRSHHRSARARDAVWRAQPERLMNSTRQKIDRIVVRSSVTVPWSRSNPHYIHVFLQTSILNIRISNNTCLSGYMNFNGGRTRRPPPAKLLVLAWQRRRFRAEHIPRHSGQGILTDTGLAN